MKLFLIVAVLLLIITVPVLAKNDNSASNGQGQGSSQSNQGNQGNQGNSDNSNSNPGQEKKEEKAQASTNPSSAKKLNTASTRSASGSAQQCDPNYPWKNHGEYVSCVAKLGLGGQAVSEAARSDIGKKNSGTPSASLSPSPDASGSATPSASVSPSPEATSSGLINSITENLASVQETLNTIGDQFAALLDLLNPFN